MHKLNKKAEAGTGISLETVGKLVLVVIILIVLWTFTVKLMGIFSSDKEAATKRNFETLVTTLTEMKDGATVTNYPLYIEDGFLVLGYWTNSNAIGGICPKIGVTEQKYNIKPTECGLANTGCICLCKYDKNFEKMCHENTKNMICKTIDDFDKDLSFEGNKQTCDFALIKGSKNPQVINMTNTNNLIIISS